MTRVGGQAGMTLIEVLVAMVMTLLIFGAVGTSLNVFERDSGTDQLRHEAQDKARSAIDRLTGELRNVAAPSKGSPGALEEAAPYSIVFQTVSSSQIFGGENKANQMRVRYCLDASTPSSETVWREGQTWTTATPPSMPPTTQCPSPVNPQWSIKAQLVSNVTNRINEQNRALFYYDSSERSKIRSVEADVFINVAPTKAHPGETELKDGVLLRNSLLAPTASFTLTQFGNHQVLLNGSASGDPNGQALAYQWYLDGSAMAGWTTQEYETRAGEVSVGSHTFKLTVTDTAGLTASVQQTVTIK
jgi:prepilin-type N-terminal cleavage/methylation domain-containing protein